MTLITLERIERLLDPVPKPESTTQEPFEEAPRFFEKLARTAWRDIGPDDLDAYIYEITYAPTVDRRLFRHVLSALLRRWYETLVRSQSMEVYGTTDLHRILRRDRVLETLITPRERGQVHAFFVDGMLNRIDAESVLVSTKRLHADHSWIERLNSLGLVAPVISDLWSEWWQLTTQGQAISALRYASGLVYLSGENPLWLPWTPTLAGAGPYLTEWDAIDYTHAWLPENIAFLRETLTPDYVASRLSFAANLLSAGPDANIARQVVENAMARRDIVAVRIEGLITGLSSREEDKPDWD